MATAHLHIVIIDNTQTCGTLLISVLDPNTGALSRASRSLLNGRHQWKSRAN